MESIVVGASGTLLSSLSLAEARAPGLSCSLALSGELPTLPTSLLSLPPAGLPHGSGPSLL